MIARLAGEQRRDDYAKRHCRKCDRIQARYDSLTSREREVFALVTEGSLNKQIAHKLGTSERTIKAHRAQVVQKMKADSVAELVRMADRLKIHPQITQKSRNLWIRFAVLYFGAGRLNSRTILTFLSCW